MGREENNWLRSQHLQDWDSVKQREREEEALNRATDREAARIRKIAEAAADRAAVWAMAEEAMPPDVRDWCVRWKIAQLGEFLWCNAFIAGWRLAMSSRLPPRDNQS